MWITCVQGGPRIVSEYNNQVGTSIQAERGHWQPGLPERAVGGPHLSGPPPMGPGQMLRGLGGGQLPSLGGGEVSGLGGGQPLRPPPVTFLTISVFGLYIKAWGFMYCFSRSLCFLHQLTPEMEKALLQQVMSLTPEQINLLPPEQRQQVIQLQEMLR